MHHVGAILLLVLAFLLLGPLVLSAFSAAANLVEPVGEALLALNLTRYAAPSALVAILLGALVVLVGAKITIGV